MLTDKEFHRYIRSMGSWQQTGFRQYLLRELRLSPEMRCCDCASPTVCPRCSNRVGFIRKGRANGKQRFACKRCGLKFSEDSEQLLSYSRLSPEAWITHLDDLFDYAPVKATSKKLQVSLTTAYTMRKKLLEHVERLIPGFCPERIPAQEAVGMLDITKEAS